MNSTVLIWNNHESKHKVTSGVLKHAHLGLANAGGHFEEQAP
jgi:hypothetical protein